MAPRFGLARSATALCRELLFAPITRMSIPPGAQMKDESEDECLGKGRNCSKPMTSFDHLSRKSRLVCYTRRRNRLVHVTEVRA
eukprot:3293764-Prymnesium_polylepis.1